MVCFYQYLWLLVHRPAVKILKHCKAKNNEDCLECCFKGLQSKGIILAWEHQRPQ